MELSRCYSYLTITTGYANRLSHRLFDGPQLIQPTMVRVQKAVVLLSGGMDSATALAMTLKEGFDVIALTLDYGQRHRREIAAAKRGAAHFRGRNHPLGPLGLPALRRGGPPRPPHSPPPGGANHQKWERVPAALLLRPATHLP